MAETDEINEFGREPESFGLVSEVVYTLLVLICYIYTKTQIDLCDIDWHPKCKWS